MASEALVEEFEVLESIYPTELSKISDNEVHIEVEPEEIADGIEPVKLTLEVRYPDGYPDVLPDLTLEPLEGEVDDSEIQNLVEELHRIGEENLGMAMTFTLVSHLRERLVSLVLDRAERRRKEEEERERLVLEAEEAKTRGTPVTRESFLAWKAKFDKEMAEKKAREDEEKMKGMTPKEREEYKKLGFRPTGRQLFERNRDLAASDDNLVEEGTVSIDISQYERELSEEEDEENQVTFSDSE
ncbi:RWD and DFRP C terminal domain-containing protein [Phanerochaete sordida]|uniref:RWD and DFRP C terminal domain-containing protein n=1 Tax=Phanerochaete sordida TaxID=48140 RepID=A0A9P3GHI9_9APHY|nr:RWD and DFRP C terminal domain-containing protein [Phanerochaete sordida]